MCSPFPPLATPQIAASLDNPVESIQIDYQPQIEAETLAINQQPISSSQFKNICINLIKECCTFEELSIDLWEQLSRSGEEHGGSSIIKTTQLAIKNEIATFKSKYCTRIEQMRKTTWKKYIGALSKKIEENPQSKMLQKEWNQIAEFRAAAIQLQNKLTALAALITGIKHSSDEWSAFGTDGNESDVDNTLSTSSIPQIDQMLIKVFADTSYTYIFGSGALSGDFFDIETYLEHPGGAREVEVKISKTVMGQLYYLELSMAELEMRNAFGDNIKGWNSYTANCLNYHTAPFRDILDSIFCDIELFYRQVHSDILSKFLFISFSNDIANRPPLTLDTNYKMSAKAYKFARLITLSHQMDQDILELAKLPCKDERNSNDINKADLLELRIAARGLLRCSFFDESYLTCGAYNITCHREGGQLSKRRDEEILRKVEVCRTASSIFDMPIISKKLRSTATPLEYVISAKENSAKFYHIVFAYSCNINNKTSVTKSLQNLLEEKIDIAICSSKYAERVTSSSLAVLKMMQQKLNKEFNLNKDLQEELANVNAKALLLHQIASGLEKCKRQKEINDLIAKKLLKEALSKKIGFEIQSNEKFNNQMKYINEAIDSIIEKFQPDGKYFNQELTPTDKYNLYLCQFEQHVFKPLNHLSKEYLTETKCGSTQALFSNQVTTNSLTLSKKITQNQNNKNFFYFFKPSLPLRKDEEAGPAAKLTSGDPAIDAIIRAKAGLSRIGDLEVQALHKLSRNTQMMRELGLGSINEIEGYFNDINILSSSILKLAQATGIVPLPVKTIGISLINLWQKTDPSC